MTQPNRIQQIFDVLHARSASADELMTSFLVRAEALNAQDRDLLAGLSEAESKAETANSTEAAAILRDAATRAKARRQELEGTRNDVKAVRVLTSARIAEIQRMVALVRRLREEHARDPAAIRKSLHADRSAESVTLLDDLRAIDSWWAQES